MSITHALALVVLFFAAYATLAGLTYARHRGTRVVHCPAARTPSRVTLDAGRAALRLSPPDQVPIRTCSQWPERSHCLQWCRDEIESAEDG